MRISENRTKPRGLADLILADSLVADGVLLQQDGSLLAAWAFSGPDLESSEPAHLNALVHRMSAALRFGTGWMVQCDVIRSTAPNYPDVVDFPDPVSAMIDDERRAQFTSLGAVYQSRYYLSLTYLPPTSKEEKLVSWLVDGSNVVLNIAEAHLRRFLDRVQQFEKVIVHIVAARRLKAVHTQDRFGSPVVYDELLQYINETITGKRHRLRRPACVWGLADSVLSSEDFVGGMEPQIGPKHIRVVAIDGFPERSRPGILSMLDQLPIEYRWSTRAILMDPYDAKSLIEKMRIRWRGQSRGFMTQAFGAKNDAPDGHALEMVEDAKDAKSEAAANAVHFCQYTSVVVILDEDLARIEESARTLKSTIENLGFNARIETVNAVEAWRGSLPGDGYSDVRRVQLHTLNLADMLPLTSVWSGLETNPSDLMPANSPPLLHAVTTGATAFRLHLHVAQVGHSLVIGPSGAGKSTALGLMAAQWFRYPHARVFAVDWDYSVWNLTHALGGEHYDLMASRKLSFCPLRHIDTQEDRTWACAWIEDLCRLNKLDVRPRETNAITDAVNLLVRHPHRTLTDLVMQVQEPSVKEALKYYTIDGPLGEMLDAEHDSLSLGTSARMVAFETKALMQASEPKASLPVLLYLFRRIEQKLDGSPTLVILDEAWAYLAHEVFRDRLDTWLRTMRRRNAAVILATQQISDIANSPIADTVFAQTATKILLPNAEATNEHNAAFYKRMGLNQRETRMIQQAVPQREYYVICSNGRRLIDLSLGEVALSFTSINSPQERKELAALMDKYPQTWQGEWLCHRGRNSQVLFDNGAQLVNQLQQESRLCVSA
jgi:type IV secretion/conjugal transfer VirB4 family ATPase